MLRGVIILLLLSVQNISMIISPIAFMPIKQVNLR